MDTFSTEAIDYDMERRKQYKKTFFEQNFKGTTKLSEAQERKIFEVAWNYGNNGRNEYEVELFFNDLTELVENCLK